MIRLCVILIFVKVLRCVVVKMKISDVKKTRRSGFVFMRKFLKPCAIKILALEVFWIGQLDSRPPSDRPNDRHDSDLLL